MEGLTKEMSTKEEVVTCVTDKMQEQVDSVKSEPVDCDQEAGKLPK